MSFNDNRGSTAAHLGGRVGARRAGLLLLVESTVTATSADAVRLGVLLTKASGSLGLWFEEDIERLDDGCMDRVWEYHFERSGRLGPGWRGYLILGLQGNINKFVRK